MVAAELRSETEVDSGLESIVQRIGAASLALFQELLELQAARS